MHTRNDSSLDSNQLESKEPNDLWLNMSQVPPFSIKIHVCMHHLWSNHMHPSFPITCWFNLHSLRVQCTLTHTHLIHPSGDCTPKRAQPSREAINQKGEVGVHVRERFTSRHVLPNLSYFLLPLFSKRKLPGSCARSATSHTGRDQVLPWPHGQDPKFDRLWAHQVHSVQNYHSADRRSLLPNHKANQDELWWRSSRHKTASLQKKSAQSMASGGRSTSAKLLKSLAANLACNNPTARFGPPSFNLWWEYWSHLACGELS